MKNNFISRACRVFIRFSLFLLPNILFPRLNVFLFNCLGYNLKKTVRVYSSTEMMGDIDITVDDGTFIGHQVLITGGKGSIHIGKNCDISDRVIICCGTHQIDVEGERVAGSGAGKDIFIGNGVWIGIGALIMPGITIGDKAIIASGAVVHKNVDDYCIVGGNPIKVIKHLDKDEYK